MAKKKYELRHGNSAKFWEIDTNGSTTIVRYGRIGSDGRIVEKVHDSPAKAKEATRKLIDQKTAKGYQIASKSTKAVTKKQAGESSKSESSKKSARKKVTKKKNAKKKTAKTATTKEAVKKVLGNSGVKLNELVDITGIIEASTCGAIANPRDPDDWTVITGFQKWKITGGDMMNGHLRIEEPDLTPRQMQSRWNRYQPESIFRFQVKLQWHKNLKCLMGVVTKNYGKSKETELTGLIQEKQKPSSFKDPHLGKFVFEPEYSFFESPRAKWMDKKASILLHVKKENSPEKCLKHAQKIHSAQKTWNKKVLDFSVTKLLKLANDWLSEEELKPVTATTFRKRIKIYSIEFDETGTISFWLDADNIFTEHAIQITGNVSGKLKAANIA